MDNGLFHTGDITSVLQRTDAATEGLSRAEAQARLERNGPNALPAPRPTPLPVIFFSQFKNPIIVILLIATAISFGIGESLDAWFIAAVLTINALIGTVLEYSAARKADALRRSVTTHAKVLRDGSEELIDAAALVPGDIVLLESGDKVPADLRLLHSHNLAADEALLTGESLEAAKNFNALFSDPDLPVGDRANMLFAGTFITKGRAKAVVTGTGLRTEIGKIAELLGKKRVALVPLIVRLETFSTKIAVAVAVIALAIMAISLYRGAPLLDIFFLTLALFVSAVPEGLPVAITVALASAAVAMSRRNVIVRKLPAIEALGSCTLIATDKTGTLTQNRLSVESFTPAADHAAACKAMIVANEAYYNREGTLGGDQVDVALASFAARRYPDDTELLEFPKADLIPYEPVQKFSGAVIEENETYFAAIKGSPEIILRACGVTPQQRQALLSEAAALAGQGYRLIGIAYARPRENGLLRAMETASFTWGGLAAIADPLREGVYEAIDRCHRAGITVVMVTGDHPETALHIAKRLGIAQESGQVADGETLARWYERHADPSELAHIRVFARVSPEQKLQIVTAFEALGHYVAVTGDGVNDAPALKAANLGVAMGRSGTDVAKETADLILTDDAFTSIVAGIEEGRRAYDNIRKVVHLLISTGFAEIVLVMLSLAFATPVPLLPLHLLWLNLVTNGIQDVALGLEAVEKHVLDRPPRAPKEPIFNAIMIRRVLLGGLYIGITAFALFYCLLAQGVPTESARNTTLLLMVLFENIHAFNSRSELRSIFRINHLRNPLLPLSVIIAQAIHIGAMQLPWTRQLLSIEPVSLQVWTELLLLSVGLVVIMEVEKVLRKKPGSPV